MRVRTYAFCAAAALCAIWPASAAATIDSIAVLPNSALSDFLCLGCDLHDAGQDRAHDAPGQHAADDHAAGRRQRRRHRLPRLGEHLRAWRGALAGGTQPAFGRYPAGARVTATQDGTSVTFALPYGAYSAGTTRLRNLPNPAALTGGVVSASAAGSFTGAATTDGAAVTATGTVQDTSSSAIPIREVIRPAHYRISLDSGTVTLFGADPLASSVVRNAERSGRRARRTRHAAAARGRRLPVGRLQRERHVRRSLALGRRARRRRADGLVPRAQRDAALGRVPARRLRRVRPDRLHRQLRLHPEVLRSRVGLVAPALEPAELHRARRRRDVSGRRSGEPPRRVGRRPVHRPG